MMLDVPVDPAADEAREWLMRELAEPGYRAAEPNLLDIIAAAVRDWITSLLGGASGPPPLTIAVIVALILGAVVLAYVIFGPPRANRRRRPTGSVFGDDDTRDAATLRRAAASAAANAEWALAIEEMFRAIARSLTERAVVTSTPGTTATGLSTRAGVYFPEFADELGAAASSFDAVRYLGAPGTRDEFQRVERLDAGIREARPTLEAAGATQGAAS